MSDLQNTSANSFKHSDPVIAFLEENQFEYIDRRDKNGCLWIVGGAEAKDALQPLVDAGVSLHFKVEGGKVTNGRPAWWTTKKSSQVYSVISRPTSTMSNSKKAVPLSTITKANDYKSQFQNWLIDNQCMARRSAESYSSAITNCEQLAAQLGLREKQLYGVDFTTARRTAEQLTQTLVYKKTNEHQHHRYSAALSKYLQFLRDAKMSAASICTIQSKNELEKKNNVLDALSDGVKEQSFATYEIYYNDNVYKGESPSEAFVAFLVAMTKKHPLSFRCLLNIVHPETEEVVISRYYSAEKLKIDNPESYVDSGLSLDQVELYIAWVIERCDAYPKEYFVKDNRGNINPPIESSSVSVEQLTEIHAPISSHLLTKEAEEYLLHCDLTGATYEELKEVLHYTKEGTKGFVAQSPYIIEMNKRLYHEDALVDFEEGADTIEGIISKLLEKNDGIVTAKLLYEYARSEMSMFLNDNDISSQQSVYDFARHLFEKLEYHEKHYNFYKNTYISLPNVSVDSVIEIVEDYARKKGSTIAFKEVKDYLAGLGLNSSNLRVKMQIDKKPVFLVYSENVYLLAELMHIDAGFLESIQSALHRLFADTDGHVIPRNISDSWYNLLPVLPASLAWTPMLLQQLIRFYSDKLEARTIVAMESQDSNTLHAMFVEKESWIQDFRDVVAVFLHDEIPERDGFEAEELRGILVNAGMISGNELITNMHNALGDDSRFIWSSDGSHVKVWI